MALTRQRFEHDGRVIYEWEQSLDEVIVYIRPPPGVTAAMIDCAITAAHVRVGLKGNPPFLDAELSSVVVVKDSMWTFDEGELALNLQKMRKGETWPAVFKGHGALDPLSAQDTQKRMLLQRFQEEHPGFDFSGADVNGAVPDPRTFMGGVKYK